MVPQDDKLREEGHMAKLLFFGVPAYGHVNPTLPVVSELVRLGHQVVYYNAEAFAGPVRGAGAEFRAYPDSGALEAEFAKRVNNLVSVSVFILEESLRLLPFALDKLEDQRPDLVVFDSIALWGMQATRLQKTPSAGSITTFVQEGVPGILKPRDYLHVLRQAFTKLPALRRLRGQLVKEYGPDIFVGNSILPCKGEINIVYTSREFQPDTPYIDDSFHFVGPSILSATRAGSDFPWEALEAGRRTVYVSLGTLYSNAIDFYRAVLRAFRDHPARFILSVGRLDDIQSLGPAPDNFIIRSHVPQLELLQKVDLFITHGGMNSINEGLNYGVPLLVVPQQIEQAINGRQVARQGAGILLADAPPYGRVDARALGRAADTILGDPGYRENAARLGRSFKAAGGYQAAAEALLGHVSPRGAP